MSCSGTIKYCGVDVLLPSLTLLTVLLAESLLTLLSDSELSLKSTSPCSITMFSSEGRKRDREALKNSVRHGVSNL
jgi:hypothetical protein